MEVSLNEIRKGFTFLITNESICIEGKITKANENAPYNMQCKDLSIRRKPLTTKKDLELLESLEKEEQIDFLKDLIKTTIKSELNKRKLFIEELSKGNYKKTIYWGPFSPNISGIGGLCNFYIYDGKKKFPGSFCIYTNPDYSYINFNDLFPNLIPLKSLNEDDAKKEVFETLKNKGISILEIYNEL